MSKLEADLYGHLTMLAMQEGAPWPLPERELHPMWCCERRKKDHHGGRLGHEYRRDRDFRCDFVWPAERVIVEVEGVVYRPKEGEGLGRHQQAKGFEDDLEKYAALQLAGWRVVRVGRRQIRSGAALAVIERALKEVA